MRRLLAFLLIGVTLPSIGGTITGTVRAEGKSGADSDALCGKYDSRQFKFVERINYAEMHDFVVYIEGPLGEKIEPPKEPVQIVTKRVEQKGAMFSPHVLPIVAGTTVDWPNNDDILHNVFSISDAKQFDLGLYKSGDKGPHAIKFDKPGRVDVFCSIHTRMSCIVLVLENPYFASTSEKGRYSIANVPPGKYRLKAWHERLPGETKELTVPETGDVKMDFVLGIRNLPKS